MTCVLQRMTVVLDAGLLMLPCSAATAQRLQQADVRYEVEQQPERHMITFWQGTTVTTETEPRKVGWSNLDFKKISLAKPSINKISTLCTVRRQNSTCCWRGCQIQRLSPNLSWFGQEGHPTTKNSFSWIDNCLMVTKQDFLEKWKCHYD